MAVRVVTDSSADLPAALIEELGITVVPLYIYFGDEVLRDGVELTRQQFYDRLTSCGSIRPRTAAPSSADFAAVYKELAVHTDGIVSLHLSRKLSATYYAAVVGISESRAKCRIEVLDSTSASLGLGLLVAQAAELAQSGASMNDVLETTMSAIPRTRFFGVLDTLEYLHKGGRIGRASALFGSVLQVKPIVGLLDGTAYPIERVRGRERALTRVCQLISDFGPIERIAVGHTTDEEGMNTLADYVAHTAPHLHVIRTQCGATLGTYLGPRAFGAGLILARS